MYAAVYSVSSDENTQPGSFNRAYPRKSPGENCCYIICSPLLKIYIHTFIKVVNTRRSTLGGNKSVEVLDLELYSRQSESEVFTNTVTTQGPFGR